MMGALYIGRGEDLCKNGTIFGIFCGLHISEVQSWRKRNMTHQCSHERAPASAHASAHASVPTRVCPRKLAFSVLQPIQRLPLECSRECSRGCSRKCTRSGLVVCHLVCFHLLCSLPTSAHFLALRASWPRAVPEHSLDSLENFIGARGHPPALLHMAFLGLTKNQPKVFLHKVQGEITYAPPPSPHFWPKGIFQGRGVGVYILRPHATGILYPPPPFYTNNLIPQHLTHAHIVALLKLLAALAHQVVALKLGPPALPTTTDQHAWECRSFSEFC